MAYTSDKKPGALTQVSSLGDGDNLVVEQSGDVKRATLTQLEGKIFDAKTGEASPTGSEVVVVRKTDDSLAQVALSNIVPALNITTGKIADGAVTDAKIGTISSTGKVLNSATTATPNNTINTIVARDGSGNFSAGTITATLAGSITGSAPTLTTGRTITLTGDVTGTTGTFNGSANVSAATTIANNAVTTAKIADSNVTTAKMADASSTTTGVTNAKLRHSAGLSVIGRDTDTTGSVADLTASNNHHVLRRSGTSLGFGQIATDGIADDAVTAAKLDGVSSLNTQTDNYTLVLGDAGRVIDMNAATDKTVTVPANSSVAFATGATILVTRRGAGELTIAGATGVTIRAAATTFFTITGSAATDIVTATGSAFIAGQVVRFTALTGGGGLSTNTDYYVVSPSTDTFQLAATSGGTAINFTTDITAGTLLANTKRIGSQNTAAALIKISTDEWLLAGNLKA